MELAITVLTYNNNELLFPMLRQFIENTDIPQQTPIHILAQCCSRAYLNSLQTFIQHYTDKTPTYIGVSDIILHTSDTNKGVGGGGNFLYEATKQFKFVLHLEDDWFLRTTDRQWLNKCLCRMAKGASTVALRLYGTDEEKWKYGWTRTIPYVLHKRTDNFNYQSKLYDIDDSSEFKGISNFLFTFNPCVRNNRDYETAGIFPFYCEKYTKEHPLYGLGESEAMEKIAHLRAEWLGVFVHFDDWVPVLKTERSAIFANDFSHQINVNCHLPVLVLHTDTHLYPTDKFAHEFFRFLHCHSPLPDIMQILAKYQPKAIVSIGSTVPQIAIPYEFRKRWLHFHTVADFHITGLETCIFVSHYRHPSILDNPLITVITPAYESKHRILRPLESLQRQTFTNWEWIIIDDSKTENTWTTLTEFAARDPRIQIYRRQHNDGSIGKNKMLCANAGRGAFLFELDHDDDILPQTFDRLLNAAKTNTDCDFFYSDFIECGEDDLSPFTYGDDFGFGFGSYWRAWYKNCFQYMCRTPRINPHTLRHIIGVPNHLRCWTRRAYLDVGGYNPELPVADDYDLIVRTLLKYRWCHIPEVLYIQYRNSGGDNFTNHRNALIQYLVSKIQATYDNEIKQRFLGLGVADVIHPYVRDYERNTYVYPILEKSYVFNDIPENPLITIIVPTYNRPNHLRRALDSIFGQTYTNFEVVVVGDCCPDLDEFVLSYPNAKDGRFKYYNLSKNYGAGGAVPRNYALKMLCATNWVAYLDDDNEWTDNHLTSLVAIIRENPKVQYVFSSMMIDGAELIFDIPRKGRIDTSCVIHRHELVVKYGLWKDRVEGGYAHDWEFFSRWLDEPYIASKQATLLYNTEFNGQTYESLIQM